MVRTVQIRNAMVVLPPSLLYSCSHWMIPWKKLTGDLQGSWREGGGGVVGGGAKGTFLRLATGGTTKQFDVDIINLQRIIKIRNFKVVNKREWYYQMLQERCLSQGDQPCLHWFFLLQEQTIILLLVTLIEWYNYQNQSTKHKYYSQESTNSHFLLTLNSLTL